MIPATEPKIKSPNVVPDFALASYSLFWSNAMRPRSDMVADAGVNAAKAMVPRTAAVIRCAASASARKARRNWAERPSVFGCR